MRNEYSLLSPLNHDGFAKVVKLVMSAFRDSADTLRKRSVNCVELKSGQGEKRSMHQNGGKLNFAALR